MNRQDRARQFMPFASLKGYFDRIREQQRITEPKKELSDSEAEYLSYKLNQLQKGQMIKVTYYNKDAYENIEGLISNVDFTFRTLTIVKTNILFDDIFDVNADFIKSLDEIDY